MTSRNAIIIVVTVCVLAGLGLVLTMHKVADVVAPAAVTPAAPTPDTAPAVYPATPATDTDTATPATAASPAATPATTIPPPWAVNAPTTPTAADTPAAVTPDAAAIAERAAFEQAMKALQGQGDASETAGVNTNAMEANLLVAKQAQALTSEIQQLIGDTNNPNQHALLHEKVVELTNLQQRLRSDIHVPVVPPQPGAQ